MDINVKQQHINITSLKEAQIHLISEIQPHGILLVLQEPDLQILQISENTFNTFGISPEDMVQEELEDLLDPYQIQKIKFWLSEENLDFINPTKIWVRKKGDEYTIFDATFYQNSQGFLILELEPTASQENIPFLSFYHLAQASINRLEKTKSLRDFSQIIVQEIRKITGFDRVMLYKFCDDGHGSVIAEEKIDSLESYLGLHYPESDIPQPARQLFLENSVRVIPDTNVQSSVEIFPKINPVSGKPIDLTNSILRSAAPCHIEYLHNMGVGASLTISLIKDHKLWGLIACHHQSPKYISYEIRKACEFLGRIIFSEISGQEETEDYKYQINLKQVQSQLVEYMSQGQNFIDGLVKNQINLLDLTNAGGAAVYFGGKYTLIGNTPPAEELNFLVAWLKNNVKDEVFSTNSLAEIYPDAISLKNVASGLLAIPISQKNYLLWFRPEIIQTVNWGGNPHQAFSVDESEGNVRLCPRKSFDLWKEIVQLTSLPWQNVEIKAALELRKSIINIVLRQADELAQLAENLQRSNAELRKFAYVASHDLQEPLNQVANYVQLLEMRYAATIDADAKEFISYVVEGVSLMQTLIDDVLAYSQVDTLGIAFQVTEVETVLNRALKNLRQRIRETGAIITHDPLPTVMADETQLIQLFLNLIGNAIKFHSSQPPKIHIGAERLEDEWLFSIQDNGIGLDPQFSDRIFIIFQRLHTRDEYPGTGMGLAICKKIIECHRGRIWVESQLGQGATELLKSQESNQLKSEFVSMLSHDIRNPLNTILLTIRLLQKRDQELTNDGKINHLQLISSAIKNVYNLLDEASIIGKSDAGKLCYQPQILDLEKLCYELVEQSQLLAQEKQLSLIFTSSEHCFKFLGDETLLKHIVGNLLNNAIKYSSIGGTILLEIIKQEKSVILRFQDQGIGITESDQKQVFQPFHRGENIGIIPGSGLGLTIVKQCVEVHGGEITVNSQVGVGSTFTVSLPIK